MFLTRVQQLQIIQAALNLELNQDENHFAQVLVLRRARRRRRHFWVIMRTWLLRRPEYGQYEHLMKELEMEDTSGFKIFFFFADGAGYVLRASATTVTPDFKLEPQGALIAHLNTMNTSVIS